MKSKKSNKKKDVTIDDLAVMVQGGFNEMNERFVEVDKRFDQVDKRFDRIEGRMMKVEIRLDNIEDEVHEIRKHQAMHTIFRDEFEKLDTRVKTLEKLLTKR